MLPANLPLVELTSRVTDPDVQAVWSLASFDPADEAHRRRVLSFYPPDGTRRLFGFMHENETLATCGVTECPGGRMTLHQVATAPQYRRRGLARRLLLSIFQRLDPAIVECGTDAPIAGFYRRCGFTLTSEGVPPSGVERFHCRLVRRGS